MQSNYGASPPRSHWGLRLLVGGVVLFVILAILFAAFVHPYYYGGWGYMMPYYGGWWFFFPFGFVVFFIFIFVVGRLLFWPWGWGGRRGYWYRHDEAADILRQRYARGEITKDQFAQMMKDLEQHG